MQSLVVNQEDITFARSQVINIENMYALIQTEPIWLYLISNHALAQETRNHKY